MRTSISNCTVQLTVALVVSLGVQSLAHAQGRRGGPPPSAEAAAPIDLTGYWVSVITADWVYRMVTPRPGDYSGVPLKPAGLQVMDAWDPAQDTAMGLQCKSYGAPASMRVPEHLHITWQDEQTLKIETDAGQQTRLLHFVSSIADANAPRSWQGYSVAQWELQSPGNGPAARKPVWGTLKITTTDLKAGYLRKNGVPYSESASVLEYLNLVQDTHDPQQQTNGQPAMVVTSVVTDPVYLSSPFVTDDNFQKLSSAAGWEPSACSAVW